MPLVIKCKKCGGVIYSSSDAIEPVSDIIKQRFNSRCPHCDRKITDDEIEGFETKISGSQATAQLFQQYLTKQKAKQPENHKKDNITESSYPYLNVEK